MVVKSNLYEKGEHIYIQMVVNLTETIAINIYIQSDKKSSFYQAQTSFSKQ